MKIEEVIHALEQFAPLPLQEDFDNAGLQVGLTWASDVSGALLCLDVTEAVVDEAIDKGCNLIVSHHPLIFHKLRSLTGADYVQRTIIKAIKNDVAIVSMHTNMDEALGGVNHKIAQKLGLEGLRFFGKTKEAEGVIGGEGVIGQWQKPVSSLEFMERVRGAFGVKCIHGNKLLERPVCKVAVCGGAGALLLQDAIAAGADAFITGEMRYHEYFGHEQEIQICVIGHYESEQYTAEIFREIIQGHCPGVRCVMSDIDTNPICYL